MHPSAKCPKCGRVLAADGELSLDGGPAQPVYSCPECVTRTSFMGKVLHLPLTFMVGPDGKPFDPANPQEDLTERE